MKFQVDGKIHKIFDTEQKSERFRTREFVIEVVDGKFPQMVKFQLTQDNCEAIDGHQEGEDITVHFDLRGREWNGKYFTNLNAWRIEPADGSSQPKVPPLSEDEYANTNTNSAADSFDDDMPF